MSENDFVRTLASLCFGFISWHVGTAKLSNQHPDWATACGGDSLDWLGSRLILPFTSSLLQVRGGTNTGKLHIHCLHTLLVSVSLELRHTTNSSTGEKYLQQLLKILLPLSHCYSEFLRHTVSSPLVFFYCCINLFILSNVFFWHNVKRNCQKNYLKTFIKF